MSHTIYEMGSSKQIHLQKECLSTSRGVIGEHDVQ